MKIKLKRFDKSILLPKYHSPGAAALDLAGRESVTIKPHTVGYVPLNIAFELPKDHWALMAARSSLHKKGVMMANGIGIGDEDFNGDNDEYQAALLNFTDREVTIKKGDRICQLIILPRERVEIEEVESLDGEDRGGYGTTG